MFAHPGKRREDIKEPSVPVTKTAVFDRLDKLGKHSNFAEAVKLIDSKLQDDEWIMKHVSYNPQGTIRTITIYGSSYIDPGVQGLLIETYKQAGWDDVTVTNTSGINETGWTLVLTGNDPKDPKGKALTR